MLSKLSRNNVSNLRKQRGMVARYYYLGRENVGHRTDRSIDRWSAIMTRWIWKRKTPAGVHLFDRLSFSLRRLPHYSQIIYSAFWYKSYAGLNWRRNTRHWHSCWCPQVRLFALCGRAFLHRLHSYRWNSGYTTLRSRKILYAEG